MPLKKCCIINCKSSSTRYEDKGVTYHKFPKDAHLRHNWTTVAQTPTTKLVTHLFVCSRHFCKRDFIKNKDSRYILNSDAVPSIFPWEVETVNIMESPHTPRNETEPDGLIIKDNEFALPNEDIIDINTSGSSKGSEVENLDNIKKFIEAQEKDLQDKIDKDVQNIHESVTETDENVKEHDKNKDAKDFEQLIENVDGSADMVDKLVQNFDDDTMEVASSVMEMMLSETEANLIKSNTVQEIPKHAINPGNSSMPLSVGSKVEAKDFRDEWYAAEIAEVDFDEMEVLVHYEMPYKKTDEWISVSSPRLRPFTGTSVPKPEEKPTELLKLLKDVNEDTKDIKTEEKNKEYVIGERCLARWRDNRRFVATIDQDLGDGKFGVIFDDGYHWSCPVSRLSKLKDTRDVLTIDTTLPSTSGAPSPVLQGGPSSGSPIPVPTFHTHLFDPTRDYLGSKSERREKKRKLNIKEIFNIGQKKQKVKVEKDKVPKEKKAVKRLVKQKVIKLEDNSEKLRTPADAVASINGSAIIENIKDEIKEEAMEFDDFYGMQQPEESTDSKSDIDPVDEEDKLERFEKPDPIMHEEVMDKMKEVISKLEGGLKQEVEKVNLTNAVRLDSPKPVLCSKPFADKQAPDTDTAVKTPPNQPSVETPMPDVETPMPDIQTPMPDIETKTPVDEPIEVDIETGTTDFEVLVADLPSPSLIDTPEEFEQNIVPDDDTTKSDIEMGNESPRLDIDSQPILVDIDAPLDDDPPESIIPQEDLVKKKPKKLRIKDFEKPKKKIKKEQKKKLLHEKWAEVDQVKNELAEMKLRMKEMLREIEREKQATEGVPLPESCLLPNEWACRWVNGQPVGKVSEIEADSKPDPSGKPALPRRSVEVVDKRLPPGWSKHMVRRSVGHSAGKWDVVLVSPENRRFHTKLDMRNFLETADECITDYEHALMDFGVHLKLSRKLGWISSTPDGVAEAPATILPADSTSCLSPLVKRKTLSLKRRPTGLKLKEKVKKRPIKLKLQRKMHTYNSQLIDTEGETSSMLAANEPKQPLLPPLEDGYVWVGSLKVQVLENLLRCPAEGCFKNFRNNTLLQMHIKHYHRELRKMMGATPKVLDLAAARSKPTLAALNQNDRRGFKVKTNRPPKRDEPKYDNPYLQDDGINIEVSHTSPTKDEVMPKIPRSQDSPKLRNMLINKPVKRPRVLLPVRRSDPEQPFPFSSSDEDEDAESAVPPSDVLDFETAISTHTVTKPLDKKKKGEKKQKSFASFAKNVSEDEEWFAMNSDELDTRSSFPRSGTPDDSKAIDPKTGMMMSSDPMDDQLDPSLYTFTDSGERVKIVHMKREEIINCHCGFREEDGLMVQCELCLCWQHALCHNIQRESEVPDKYTCSICLNPRRGRRSRRFVHDQDRLYEGLVAGARPDDALRRTHELSGNLLRVQDALHALRLKHYVTTKKDHPKLYLWAKDWEQADIPFKLNSDYSDLSIMLNGMDKENLPMKPDDPHLLDMRTVTEDDTDSDRFSQRDAQLGSQALLSGLLSSPSAASLDLPISTSELERLAKTVQEAAEWQGQGSAGAPQPEAAIDNEVCRDRLLKHIQRCQQLIDSRLDSIEAQVAELESQDPSFGVHYETAESYPRTKQTVQMLMRDLDTMEELGVIT